MKVLIVGGTGILSSAVVDDLVRRGSDVTMINRGNNQAFINDKARLIKCDIREPGKLENLLNGMNFDCVVDFLVFNEEQLKYSLSVFSKITKQYVFISSAQAYNTSKGGTLTEESELLQPLWSYSVNKVKCERFLTSYCQSKGINFTIIRPGVNYGNTRIPYGIYPEIGKHWTFVARILAGKPIITWNNGENRLNLTRVEDFAAGMVGLLGAPNAYNQAFNVVGDLIYSWKDVLQTLSKILNVEIKTIDIPVDFYSRYLNLDDREALLGGRSYDLVCSNEKMKKIVPNFRTKYTLEEGLKLTLDFYEKTGFYHGFDYAYDAASDRIIRAYCKSIHIRPPFGLHFVDYQKQGLIARRIGHWRYCRERFSEQTIVRKTLSFQRIIHNAFCGIKI